MPERLKLESLNAADGAVTAVVCGGGVRLALRYRLAADGELAVSYDLRIADTLPEPLRIGLQALWSGELDRYVYCGRGPGENYADRKEGSLFGVYSGSTSFSPAGSLCASRSGPARRRRWMRRSIRTRSCGWTTHGW